MSNDAIKSQSLVALASFRPPAAILQSPADAFAARNTSSCAQFDGEVRPSIPCNPCKLANNRCLIVLVPEGPAPTGSVYASQLCCLHCLHQNSWRGEFAWSQNPWTYCIALAPQSLFDIPPCSALLRRPVTMCRIPHCCNTIPLPFFSPTSKSALAVAELNVTSYQPRLHLRPLCSRGIGLPKRCAVGQGFTDLPTLQITIRSRTQRELE